jgi:dinuclear metal center YbgI/SA1388 family protein
MTPLGELARALDELMRTREVPDYPNALNGIQVGHRGPVKKIAAAVDVSVRTIDAALAAGANLLMVHHGLFWGGVQPIVGAYHERLRRLIENDIAVYASHLPLDLHPVHGNSALLARELGLAPSGEFARFKNVFVGVQGETDIATVELIDRASRFCHREYTALRTSAVPEGHHTKRWAICSGAGASAETVREALDGRIDTLIVGEGPHWTAVDAPDHGLAILYAGHYATETLGIRSLAQWAGDHFALPWVFIDAPTGF